MDDSTPDGPVVFSGSLLSFYGFTYVKIIKIYESSISV
jgi:hypothetical protein